MSREIDVKALVSHLVRGDGADKCRICMGDTSDGQVYLGDTVMMDGERPVTLAELLEVITGVEVDLAASLPAHACGSCATSAALAAPFVRLCQASDKKWHDITNYLNNIQDTAKTAFVFVDDDSIAALYDPKEYKNKKQALNSFKRTRPKTYRGKMQCDAKCPECDKGFTNVVALNVHLKDLRIMMCYKCKNIMPIDAYVSHAATHNISAYMCKNCATVYHCEGMYLRHQKLCKYRGSHVCTECNKRFPFHFNLVAHVACKHSPKVCAACGKKFGKLCFSYHLKKCVNSKPLRDVFICDYCSKEYNHKNALKLHIRHTHLVGWEYQCDQCGKKFSNPAHLREHDNTHNRVEDRYICSVCGTKFSTRRGYERHYKRHFDERGFLTTTEPRKKRLPSRKLYMCIACDFRTVKKKTLSNHMKAKHQIMEWSEV